MEGYVYELKGLDMWDMFIGESYDKSKNILSELSSVVSWRDQKDLGDEWYKHTSNHTVRITIEVIE